MLKKELIYNYNNFLGVDEVGRGCLAGPVLAAAVLVERRDIGKIEGVRDSKKIREKQRETLFEAISKNHEFSFSLVDAPKIDEMNILNASLSAMAKSVRKIKQDFQIVLVDGPYKIPGIKSNQLAQIKGDQNFYSIAAASIVAKVLRDRIMKEYHLQYPEYSFNQHKGYGTKVHKDEIKLFGTTPIHRRSFNLY